MRARLLIASIALLIGGGAAAQQEPLGSFIICPGNPRCPSGAATPAPYADGPGISSTRGFSLGRPTAAAPSRRPRPSRTARPPAREAGATIRFGPNSVSLDDAARAQLDELATILAGAPQVRIFLEGHAAASGPPAARGGGAAQRAQAVADYLVSRGIARDRLQLVSWGSSQPAVGPDAQALSRRVDIRRADQSDF